jgi:hypothetical protein
MKRLAATLAVLALLVIGVTVWAQSGQTVTFTNTAQASVGKGGQFTVPVDPYPSAGSIYYSPYQNTGVYTILFWGTTPSVAPANNVHGVKTRLVQPTTIYNGCPIGALDKLEFTAQPFYNPVTQALEGVLNAEQYIGNYTWTNGGGGRGGGSSGCFSHIMPAGTALPDGTVTSGGFTSVTYP